jgi:hypothetical protein
VDLRYGVVGEQVVVATGELQVVADVAAGFLGGHAGHVVAGGDALVAASTPSLIIRRRVGWPSSTEAVTRARALGLLAPSPRTPRG